MPHAARGWLELIFVNGFHFYHSLEIECAMCGNGRVCTWLRGNHEVHTLPQNKNRFANKPLPQFVTDEKFIFIRTYRFCFTINHAGRLFVMAGVFLAVER